ncbi:hypothetical protein K7W03_13655, partial [Sphingobium sp. PNB]|nr:hypothetical protein [Sphingobium sp. PNB]
MAFRDLIPWSRQENRLPVSVSAEQDRDTHPLQSLHREVNRLFDDVLRGFNMPAFAGFDRRAGWPHLASLIHDARFRARSGHLLRLAVLRGRPAS